MPKIYQYLQLYEAESETISRAWKIVNIILYILGALSGMGGAISIATLSSNFDDNCILNSNIKFSINSEYNCSSSVSILVDAEYTKWGADALCEFSQYVSVMSTILCLIWITFFTMCGKGGKSTSGLSAPWRIVIPSLTCSVLFFFVVLVAAVMTQNGLLVFCGNFEKNMDENICSNILHYLVPKQCSDLEHRAHSYDYFIATTFFVWFTAAIWLFINLLLILRCSFVADFQLYSVQIYSKHPTLIESLQYAQDKTVSSHSKELSHKNVHAAVPSEERVTHLPSIIIESPNKLNREDKNKKLKDKLPQMSKSLSTSEENLSSTNPSESSESMATCSQRN